MSDFKVNRRRSLTRAQRHHRRNRQRVPVGTRRIFEWLEDRRVLSAVSWDGGGDGTSWSNRFNWSGDALPGAGDDVTINAAANVTITHASGSDTIKSLSSSNAINLSGGTLSVLNSAALSKNLTLSGGTLKDTTITTSGGAKLILSNSGGTLDN